MAQRREIAAQIGVANLFAISGGRIKSIEDGIELPVSNGYTVRVQLTPLDDYTVSRVFRRASREWIHGQKTGVYFDEVGDASYYASCFRSYDADEWPSKIRGKGQP